MKLFIRIFALLILASCQDETIPNRQCYFSVTLSDALPVQFWQTGCSTYNETVPKGVHEKCFCAPWQCDDQLRIQFQEDISPDADYFLAAQDADNNILASLEFTEVEAGIHSVYFSPETEGICDDLINLLIVDINDASALIAPNLWDDETAGVPFTSMDDTTFTYTDASTPADGATARQPLLIPAGMIITFDVEITFSGTFSGGSGANYFFSLTDSDGNTIDIQDESGLDAGTYTKTISLTATTEAAYLNVNVGVVSSPGESFTAEVTIPVNTIFYVAPGNELAKSDCLDVRLSFDDDYPTELIEYSNTRNFAGLVYSDISPDASFNIRVPARFFHELFPEEDEAIELTSSVITTSGQIKSQKLLEVMQAPYYFHKKLQLILKHQSVTINGTSYQKEEKYEIIENNKRWPLKQATCLLTEKNSVLRNVI